MSLRLFVPCDAAALCVGADEVAQTLQATAAKRGLEIEIVRNGSRGMCWLEPMIEVATPKGRVAFGPVTVADVPSLLDAITADKPHKLGLGLTEQIPWLKRQTRLTFARCGVTDPLSLEDYRAHGGYRG